MITPVSASEFEAQRSGSVPVAQQVTDGTWTLPLVIPPGHMPYTLAYLIEDGEGRIHIVDPGWNDDRNLHAVEDALRGIGRSWGSVASVIVTHLHPDHIGLAGRLRKVHGVPIVLHPAEQAAQERLTRLESQPDHVRDELTRWGVPAERFEEVRGYATKPPRVVIDGGELVEDGQLLRIPGRSIRVLHTPGHTPGHICLHDEENGLLFTGDHVLPTIVPGLGLGGPVDHNPLERYLHCMADMARYDNCEVLPGHGYRFRGVKARASVIARQHLRRTAEVAQLLEGRAAQSTWETAAQLTWSRGWRNLTRQYLIGALRQTEMHVRLVSEGEHSPLLELWGVGSHLGE